MDIKFILFDWSGTLGEPGMRKQFVSNGKKGWLPFVPETLWTLSKHGVKLGILSNTQTSAKDMARGFRKAGMTRLFPVQVYSSDENMCSKPCQPILEEAWRQIHRKYPSIKKHQVMYVGNNYFTDVWPAARYGFKTGLVSNGDGDVIFQLAQLMGMQDVALLSVAELPCELGFRGSQQKGGGNGKKRRASDSNDGNDGNQPVIQQRRILQGRREPVRPLPLLERDPYQYNPLKRAPTEHEEQQQRQQRHRQEQHPQPQQQEALFEQDIPWMGFRPWDGNDDDEEDNAAAAFF